MQENTAVANASPTSDVEQPSTKSIDSLAVDLTGDGGVTKEIIVEGTGEIPPTGSEVSVHYTGTLLSDGSEFDSSRKRDSPFSFALGSHQVIKGWEVGVATMKVGERANLVIKPDYGYGTADMGPIPPDSTLKFDVELVDFRAARKDPWTMTTDEKLQAALEAKERGNDHFKKGEITKSLIVYNQGLEFFEKFDEWSESASSQGRPIKLSLHLNLANCFVKTKSWLEAIIQSSSALDIEPSNSKALYRRGVARMHFSELEGAKADLVQAAKIELQNVDIRRTLEECKKKIADEKQKAATKFGGMFDKFGLYEDKSGFAT